MKGSAGAKVGSYVGSGVGSGVSTGGSVGVMSSLPSLLINWDEPIVVPVVLTWLKTAFVLVVELFKLATNKLQAMTKVVINNPIIIFLTFDDFLTGTLIYSCLIVSIFYL